MYKKVDTHNHIVVVVPFDVMYIVDVLLFIQGPSEYSTSRYTRISVPRGPSQVPSAVSCCGHVVSRCHLSLYTQWKVPIL